MSPEESKMEQERFKSRLGDNGVIVLRKDEELIRRVLLIKERQNQFREEVRVA